MKLSKVVLIVACALLGISIEAQESLVENSTVDENVTVPELSENPKVETLEAGAEDEILDFDAVNASDVGNTTDGTEPVPSNTDPIASNTDPVPSSTDPVQSGPFIDLFGPTLLSLKMIDESHAQMVSNFTIDVLRGKSVVGVYFSADW